MSVVTRIRTSQEITLPFPSEEVWDVLADVPSYPDWWPASLGVEVIHHSGELLGAEFEVRPFLGRPFRIRFEELEGRRSMRLRFFGGSLEGPGGFHLHALEGATQVRYEMDVFTRGLDVAAMSLILPLESIHRSRMRSVLKNLAGRLKALRKAADRKAAHEAHSLERESADRRQAEEKAARVAAEEASRKRVEEEAAARAAAEELARHAAAAESERRAAEAEAMARAAEEAAHRAAEEEARRRAEEDAARVAAEEASRKRAEDEALARAAAEKAERLAAEEEAERRAIEAEAKVRAEEEAARRAAEEEARRHAEEDAAARAAAEEAERRAVAEEALRVAAEEEARKRAEEDAAARTAAEAAERRAAEEAAERRAADAEAKARAKEEAARRAVEEEARKRAEAAAAAQAAAEEAERRAAEDERLRVAAEEGARRRAEEEAAARAAAEEAQRRAAEEEAERRAAEAEAKAQAEGEAARRAAEEEARKRAEEDAAARTAAEAAERRAAEEEAEHRVTEAEAKRAEEDVARRAADEEEKKQAQDASSDVSGEIDHTERAGDTSTGSRLRPFWGRVMNWLREAPAAATSQPLPKETAPPLATLSKPSNFDTARLYLEALSSRATADEIGQFFAPEAIHEEFPHRFLDNAVTRGFGGILEAKTGALARFTSQRYELTSATGGGSQVAMEVRWKGAVATTGDGFTEGHELDARIALFLKFADGRIVRQRTYACFEPWSTKAERTLTLDERVAQAGRAMKAPVDASGPATPEPVGSNFEIARRYLQALSERADAEAIARYYTPDAVQDEFPNRFRPGGAHRDLQSIKLERSRGLALMASESYELLGATGGGSQVALEVAWSAAVGEGMGGFNAGQTLEARLGIFLKFQNGLIVAQRNYDCVPATSTARM